MSEAHVSYALILANFGMIAARVNSGAPSRILYICAHNIKNTHSLARGRVRIKRETCPLYYMHSCELHTVICAEAETHTLVGNHMSLLLAPRVRNRYKHKAQSARFDENSFL